LEVRLLRRLLASHFTFSMSGSGRLLSKYASVGAHKRKYGKQSEYNEGNN
jgi:hypothetical protein